MKSTYRGPERRKFLRLEYVTPLACKVCKPETISKILEGYTMNISQAGAFCHISAPVHLNDIVWLSFDRATLSICKDIEKDCFIYQNGIIGKVVRMEGKSDGTHNVGVQFIVREEQNLTNIYPKIHFLNYPEAAPVPEEAQEQDEDREQDEGEEPLPDQNEDRDMPDDSGEENAET
ncbi:MAG: PilZ domain-containing protein [Deltaproteobacteria bacterium]